MRVCFFGIYNPNYSRNRVLEAGFLANNYEVVHCRVNPQDGLGPIKYWKLYQKYRELNLAKNPCDLNLVAFPGQTVVWLALLLFGKKFIYDAFVSLYDSNVRDRRLYSNFNPHAWRDFFWDWLSVSLAPVVLLDTEEHIKYFSKIFNLNPNKAIRVFVGTDNRFFYPAGSHEVALPDDKFIVHFHGSYIPLQGVEYIIRVADKLRKKSEIIFQLIGCGQERSRLEKLAQKLEVTNIKFIDRVDYDKLRGYLNYAHVCLGIFGITEKAGRVIPNKVFEALACGRPIITMDTPAIRELLHDGQDVVLCQVGDEQSLLEAILKLKKDVRLREKIGLEARKIYKEELTPIKLVAELLVELKK